MDKKTGKILKITLPLLLGVALVWYSLSKISIEELVTYFKNADYTYIGLGLFFGFLSHLSRAYRWKFMIEPMGYTLRLPNSIMAVFATYLVNYTIPRAGEITRATILTNYEGVPFEKGFGTIVAERIADMVVMLGIIAVTLFLEFDFIYQFFAERFDPYKIIIGIIGLLVLATLIFLFIKRSQSKFAIKVRTFLNGLLEGILSIFKMKHKWAFIFHTLFIWAMYVLMFYITTLAIPETSNLPLAAILIGFISASFSIAATNGGIGSYPVAVYAAFSIFAIAKEPSIAFGWIMWSSQTFMIIVLGGLSLIYLPIYNRIK
ncbi:lysylphosphatidylglycerol synthase transmembrane domain-containing protein [Psychroserpens luteolus]|uniref:lysylphosphatidylglycerol synthase transmembrane domain-containing protein n=1 Tax=Psychroserpens luteolus TaxID=2855840 RepID=UPI001E32FFAC|nr:lysylphosphatidylglycerol synthase transmembrane domain-containing protein [Psychroserpens luteolus]MCD2257988.1 flippase-like domain-containing protein [Psychroserpens luteolus]